MAHIVLQCPDCRQRDNRTGWKTINGRGKCRCGSYLVHHFSGLLYADPEINTWDMSDEDNPKLVKPGYLGTKAAYRLKFDNTAFSTKVISGVVFSDLSGQWLPIDKLWS
jgi:hypothetical protein